MNEIGIHIDGVGCLKEFMKACLLARTKTERIPYLEAIVLSLSLTLTNWYGGYTVFGSHNLSESYTYQEWKEQQASTFSRRQQFVSVLQAELCRLQSTKLFQDPMCWFNCSNLTRFVMQFFIHQNVWHVQHSILSLLVRLFVKHGGITTI